MTLVTAPRDTSSLPRRGSTRIQYFSPSRFFRSSRSLKSKQNVANAPNNSRRRPTLTRGSSLQRIIKAATPSKRRSAVDQVCSSMKVIDTTKTPVRLLGPDPVGTSNRLSAPKTTATKTTVSLYKTIQTWCGGGADASRTRWMSLMELGKLQATQEKNYTVALVAWNDALTIRRNHFKRSPFSDEQKLDGDRPRRRRSEEEVEEDEEQQCQRMKDVAMTLNCIGIALCMLDSSEQHDFTAFDAFDKALSIRQDTLGPGHKDCVDVVHNMWILLHNVNERSRKAQSQDSVVVKDSFYKFELRSFRGLE